MDEKKNIAFNFGENWQSFSQNSLDTDKFKAAVESLRYLIGPDNIKDRSFLDIGCGSGIFAIAASLLEAKKVIGIDISKESVAASMANKDKFAPQNDISFFHTSIFDDDIFTFGTFDIVYSWGVLHHTGDMDSAIDRALRCVAAGGLFVIAIYNKHRSSGAWKQIKRLYNAMPKPIQRLMIWFFYMVIALAKLIVTRKNPFVKKKRGMSFYHDVVDWVGGYPYEYADKEDVVNKMKKSGFTCVKFVKPAVPTGCNEFVFLKDGVSPAP
ncbi:MAG: class I SAM-dependent methyltransferase [Planctomycetes bacterium]|nr:class I SAM-dependent methyltransferase [Planctomycetota bacterium]